MDKAKITQKEENVFTRKLQESVFIRRVQQATHSQHGTSARALHSGLQYYSSADMQQQALLTWLTHPLRVPDVPSYPTEILS